MNRTIDANFNRFKEGLRVVEDILRYEFSSPLAFQIKELRHIKLPNYEEVIKSRDAKGDIKPTTKDEFKRSSIKEVVIANLKRAQESARVLEELYKLKDLSTSNEFKNARYTLYDLEKEIFKLF